MDQKPPASQNTSSLPFAGRIGGNQQFAILASNNAAVALPFAGRIGGNQEYTVNNVDSNGSEARQFLDQDLVKKTPDAAPLLSLRAAFDLKGFFEPIIWRAAIIECWGTSMLVFASGMIATALGPLNNPDSLRVPLIVALTNWIAITLFIFAAAPASGGHLNPFITLATLTAGLSTFSRSLLYITGQCIGGIIGAFLLKLGLGSADYFPSGIIGGCTIDNSLISFGQAYVLEAGSSLVTVFLAFGVGLDPRQRQVFGPALSPILVGLTVAFMSFATGFVKGGWYGASINPARCIGLMAANEDLQGHWIHWLAAVSATAINGIFYYFIPPYHQEAKTR